MRILSLSNCVHKNNSVSCRSTHREIILDGTTVCQTTKMYRGMSPEEIDFVWSEFEHKPKVNFINLACSDGSEPMSWAMALMEKYGKQADKFFPIKASDIDYRIIYKAQDGLCLLSYDDVDKLKLFTNNDYFKYCYREYSEDCYYPFAISPKTELKSKIVYDIADAENVVKNIENVPTFLLGCNFMPYLKCDKRERLITTIAEKFNKDSILKIGDFDLFHGIDKLLCQNGLEPYKRRGYFKKII